MIDEEELQRRELARLLSTAKDKDRQELIRKALQALDEQEKLNNANDDEVLFSDQHNNGNGFGQHIASINPTTQSSLLGAHSIPTLETFSIAQLSTESPKTMRMRPMSARRRTSVPNLLDAIPEVIARNSPHKGSVRKQHTTNVAGSGGGGSSNNSTGSAGSGGGGGFGFGGAVSGGGINRSVSSSGDDSIMPYEDVAEVIASSYDNRFPPKVVFRHSYKTLPGVGGIAPTANTASSNHASHFSHAMTAISEDATNFNVDEEGDACWDGYFPFLADQHSNSNSDGTANSSNNSNNDNNSNIKSSITRAKKSQISRPPQHLQCWVSTGLVPQFLSVVFFEKWIVKKVEVRSSGVKELGLQINPNASSTVSSARMMEMRPIGKSSFVWDAAGDEEAFDYHGGGIPGIGLTFVIGKTRSMFIRVQEVKVTVFPYS